MNIQVRIALQVLPLTLAFVSLLQTATFAEPELMLTNASGDQGTSVTVEVQLQAGDQPYAGLDTKILLPDGVRFLALTNGPLLSSESFIVESRSLSEDNAVVIVAYSSTETISASSGVLFTLELQLEADAVPGALSISLAIDSTRYTLATSDGVAVPYTLTGGTITVAAREDTEPPVLTLLGGDEEGNIILACDAVFEDPGATTVDVVDGDLTAAIVVSGDAVTDTSEQGIFQITYTVTNAAGLSASASRIVTVDCLPEDATLRETASVLHDNFADFDGDDDGFLARGEASLAIPGLTDGEFDQMDEDGDAQLSEAELDTIANPKSFGCYGSTGAGGTGSSEQDILVIALMLFLLLSSEAISRHRRANRDS